MRLASAPLLAGLDMCVHCRGATCRCRRLLCTTLLISGPAPQVPQRLWLAHGSCHKVGNRTYCAATGVIICPVHIDARRSQEWKEMSLPEIDYHTHNKVESWSVFYGDVKVRQAISEPVLPNLF